LYIIVVIITTHEIVHVMFSVTGVSVCTALLIESLDPEIFLFSICLCLKNICQGQGHRSKKWIWWYVRSRQTYFFKLQR